MNRMSSNDSAFIIMMIVELLIFFPLIIFMIICRWKIFVKAGQEGWYSIIPLYNTYIYTTKIAGKDDMMFVLHLIPIVSIYAYIVTNIGAAKSFGKDEGFGIGLTFLAIIFMPMLAFGKATFIGPGGEPPAPDSTNSLTTDWQTGPPQV